MLNLAGEKMAKSTGHVVTLLEWLERWNPIAVRLFYLRTHYRKPLDFSEQALDDAEASLSRLRAFRRRFPAIVEEPSDPDVIERFRTVMDDDLDVAGALAVLFDLVREGNSRRDVGESADALVSAFDEIVSVLGIGEPEAELDDEAAVAELAARFGITNGTVDDLIVFRTSARRDRDWATSDAIRDGLAALNIIIEDTSDGTRWHRG